MKILQSCRFNTDASERWPLTLIWVGSLRVRFEVEVNLLELCKKLEIWYVSIQTYVISENIPFSIKALLILLMLAFFLQKSAVLAKIVSLL